MKLFFSLFLAMLFVFSSALFAGTNYGQNPVQQEEQTPYQQTEQQTTQQYEEEEDDFCDHSPMAVLGSQCFVNGTWITCSDYSDCDWYQQMQEGGDGGSGGGSGGC